MPASAAAQEASAVSPPEVLTNVDAVYPAEALESRQEGTSVLLVTVDSDGAVVDAEVAESGGAAFDGAAMAAIRQWTFRPAFRDGAPVRSRLRVPFRFAAPDAPPAPEVSPPVAEGVAGDEQSTTALSEKPIDVTVHGERQLRTEDRSASDFTVDRAVLEAAPRQEGAETLRTVPGLYIARAEGLAVAHRYSLRGFDADHGQDIEFRVGGLPINLPSHIHGQGYADLGFMIAEATNELQASEGVYDPRQGDFAVAGSIDASLGVARRGIQLKSSYGAFDTSRQLLLWAPEGEPTGTFGAVQYVRTGGFGQNRAGQAASAMAQSVFGSGPWRYRALGILYGARANLAGVVRADDVADGRIGYYDVYPYATARGQNALSARFLGGLFAEYRGAAGDNGEIGVWAGLDNLRLQQNFTGFIQRSQTLANVAGRGDLIEQQNRTLSLGLTARYRTRPYRASASTHGTLELGLAGRLDTIEQAQNLLDAGVRGQTWDRRVDANILGADVGFWSDIDTRLTRLVHLRLGVRGDVLYYDVDDRLGNFAPLTRAQDNYIVGYRRGAYGLAAGPRTSLEVKPREWLALRAAYGEGYRSPQARILDDGESAPFSKVRSADLGARLSWDDRYQLTFSGYFTQLSDDVAFDAEEGRLERIGATRRLGGVLHAQARPVDWIIGAFSVTYVNAELLEPPPASAEEPQPPFEPGQQLPFVPPVVARLDLGATPTIARGLGAYDLRGRAGVGFSYLSPRPLPYGVFARHVALLDASAGLGWGPFDLTIEIYNLLDSRYAATELNFPSSWDPESARSRTPARHIAAGAPLSWLATLGVTL